MSQRNIKPVLRFADLARERAQVRVLLTDRPNLIMEATITGFDDFMNILLENTIEINTKANISTPLGSLLLKSDCIAMILKK